MKTIQRQCTCLLWTLLLVFFSVQTALASACAGDVNVMLDGTTTINLASVYQRTLSRSRVISYQWRSENSSKVRVTSSTRNYARVKGVMANTTCRVYFYCSYIIDGFFRKFDFYYDVKVIGGNVSVTQVSVNHSNLSMKLGSTIQLTANAYPTNATNRRVNWSSSRSSVASVSSTGLVTANGTGTAWIYCTAADGSGKYGQCRIEVTGNSVLVTNVTLNKSSISLEKGKTFQLSANVTPSNAANKNVSWSSGNSLIATVSSSGLVTAKGAGTTTITCAAKDNSGKKATCIVTVTNQTATTSLVQVSLVSATLQWGDQLQLNAVSDNGVSTVWSSSDTTVATVSDNGLIKAIGTGEVTISCKPKTGQGNTVTFTIQVRPLAIAIMTKNSNLDEEPSTEEMDEEADEPETAEAWNDNDVEDLASSRIDLEGMPSYRIEAGAIILQEVAQVTLYNLSGVQVYNGQTDRVDGLTSGYYILMIAGYSEKIAIP